jgi:LacI family gluconate utilization system Gnt-I transcriptional repressor
MFNDPAKVASATRERISRAIAETGYVPDLTAARLAGRKRATIGAIVPSLEATYFSQVLRGISREAERYDASLMIGETEYKADKQDTLLRTFLGWRLNGIVHMGGPLSDAALKMLAESRTRLVEAWQLAEAPVGDTIGFSNREAVHQLAAALLRAGRRRLVYAARAGDQGRALIRQRGYEQAIAAAGLEPRVVEVAPGRSGYDAGAAALVATLERFPDSDAIIFSGDTLAAGAIFECQRRGIAVPGKLAIAGFGDLDFAVAIVPALTTVRIPNAEIGKRSAELILRGGAPVRDDVGFELVQRDSAPLA